MAILISQDGPYPLVSFPFINLSEAQAFSWPHQALLGEGLGNVSNYSDVLV